MNIRQPHVPPIVRGKARAKVKFGAKIHISVIDGISFVDEYRNMLKGKGIHLKAKPLGRPSALSIDVSPGERNPIEGKFGQVKTAYGLGRIKARLKETGESWIAGIFPVLNLVKLAGVALPCLILNMRISLTACLHASIYGKPAMPAYA